MANEWKVEFVVTEMKNIGQIEASYWSDDDKEYKKSGPRYVRIVADDGISGGGDCRKLKLELPEKVAAKFRVGGKLNIGF